MSETPTINVKTLSDDVKAMKEMLEALQPKEPGAKGHVEESIEKIDEALQTKKKINTAFKEFLKTAAVGKTFTVEEAIGAQTSTAAIPTVWSAEPELLSPEGADGYFLTPITKWKTDIKGQPGDNVKVQTVGAVAAAAITSGTEPTFSASTLVSIPVTLVQRGHGFYITKGDLEDIEDGTVEMIEQQSKNAILRVIDDYFLSQIQDNANNVGAGTIIVAAPMSATVLATMWGKLMSGSYKPKATVMYPMPYASLLRDSQFTNAATRGKSSIIDNADIGNYLGMDIVPLIQGTLNFGGTAGTYKTYMLSQGAMVGAIKRDISVEREYYVKDQRNYFVASVRFGGTPVHLPGIGMIRTVD